MSQGAEDFSNIAVGWVSNIIKAGSSHGDWFTIYTVPEGKTFYLTSWWVFQNNEDDTKQWLYLYLYDKDTLVTGYFFIGWIPAGEKFGNAQSLPIPFKMTENESIRLKGTDVAAWSYAGVTGFER